LLLIEQAIEQHTGCALVVWCFIHSFPEGLASGTLFLSPGAIFGGVKIQAVEIVTVDSTAQRQLPQGIFDRHVQYPFQLTGHIANRSVLHRRFRSLQECAVPGNQAPRASQIPCASKRGIDFKV
jgi:hypothetical protein